MSSLTPFIWFESGAEQAVDFYVELFEDARIGSVSRYAPHTPGEEGAVMTVEFELRGQPFVALNGGPHYALTPAISFVVTCETQAEIDRFWSAFEAGGTPMQCGWVTDRFGVTWQVVPAQLSDWIGGADEEGRGRAVQAMLAMGKFDIAAMQSAYGGDVAATADRG
jgi:predicted 3-demethylubiquinone-9 3-methyltransferase (glyoxalase superfamily)